MKWKVKYIFLGLLLAGGILFNQAISLLEVNTRTLKHSSIPKANTRTSLWNKLLYLSYLFCGVFFFCLSISYLSVKAGLLDLIECSIFMFTSTMMVFFEVLGLLPLWWVLMILFPAFVCLIVYEYLKRLRLERG